MANPVVLTTPVPAPDCCDQLHTDLLAIDSDLDVVISQIGEVQSTPTANTVLDRLKAIAENTANIQINAESVNLNTDELESKLESVKTKLDSLIAQVGEVQASPTTNTILDRLKAIKTSIDGLTPLTDAQLRASPINVVIASSASDVNLYSYAEASIAPSASTDVIDFLAVATRKIKKVIVAGEGDAKVVVSQDSNKIATQTLNRSAPNVIFELDVNITSGQTLKVTVTGAGLATSNYYATMIYQ